MSYIESLQAAGATVLQEKFFGSYQGDWLALVIYGGKTFWVHGSYGSCSGCDAFCAEFDFDGDDNGCDEHRYDKVATCTDCQARSADYQRRLADFGRGYLTSGEMTQAEVEKSVSEHLDWDSEAQDMVDFVKEHAIPNPEPKHINDRS
jgi:hypothetical protein